MNLYQNFSLYGANIPSSVNFKATVHDSRIDFHKNHDLKSEEIIPIDDKVFIGRAPGKAEYGSDSKSYYFDDDSLSRDIEFLKCHKGVDTIIDLRNPKYEGGECIKAERQTCADKSYKNDKINYVNIPLDSAIAPTEEELETFFDAISKSKGKVYIHCHAGKDRTGIMSSCYLAKKHGLTKQEAFNKVFKKREIRPLTYMKGHPDECHRFDLIMESLRKTGNVD